ncbi:MAG: hypothetical protein R3B90_13470 [Planctomycetaceae bacterium]
MNSKIMRVNWLAVWLGLTTGGLVGLSFPLWWEGGPLPRVPWLASLCGVPIAVDQLLTVGLGIAVTAMVAVGLAPGLRGSAGPFRAAAGMFAVTLGGLLLLDQQRLQPWAWQCWLMAALVVLTPTSIAVRCGRWLLASIYFWSGISKIDPLFVEQHGQLLLGGLLTALGREAARLPEQVRLGLAWGMPAIEIVIAVALVMPALRKAGRLGATLMHLLLLMALGPLGLNHHAGVLGWNAALIVLVWLLFSTRVDATEVPEDSSRILARSAMLLACVAIAAPLLTNFHQWDYWPGWSVYSSRPATVTLMIDEAFIDELPASLRPLVGSPAPLERWCRVGIEQWSFVERRVPAYPQERWKLAVARTLVDSLPEGTWQVTIARRDGWWGRARRTSEPLSTRSALERELTDGTIVNTQSR